MVCVGSGAWKDDLLLGGRTVLRALRTHAHPNLAKRKAPPVLFNVLRNRLRPEETRRAKLYQKNTRNLIAVKLNFETPRAIVKKLVLDYPVSDSP